MKRLLAMTALAAVLLTSGCVTADPGQQQDRTTDTLRQESITLDDGRTVQCVIYASGYKGGVSCDWESAQ